MTTKNDGLELSLKPKNAYLYRNEDMTKLMVLTSEAADNSVVKKTTPGSEAHESYTGTFNAYIGNQLNLISSGVVDTISSSVPSIEVDQKAAFVNVKAGAYTYSAPTASDKLGLRLIASPTKSIFKPVATRYELDSTGMDSLRNTLGRLVNAETVYRVSGTQDANTTFGYMTVDKLLELAGVSPLRSGSGVCKHKGIKIFKLKNGLGFKLGDSVMIAVTEAAPRFAEKDSLYVKQEDPETGRWYLEPVSVKISKGFNPTLSQFAYDVTMKNGNQLFDIPESDLMVDNIAQQEKSIEDVQWNHFQ